MKLTVFLRLIIMTVNGLWCALAVADGAILPFVPRMTLDGLIGSDGLAGGDAMVPVYGDERGIFFLDIAGKTAFDNPSLASLGGGLRKVWSEDQILGAYVFADRSVSDQSNAFWFVSPGIESMGRVWDFRANGYIPTGSTRVSSGSGFADEFGNYNYVSFNQHNQFDVLVNNFEEVGWGVDGEIGRRIPGLPAMRAYLGGYHFNLENADDINGVSARLEYPITRLFTFSLRNSYDNNQNETIEAQFSLTLGGVNDTPQDPNQPIEQRLLDPISRNLATLGQANGEPIVNEQEVVSGSIIENSNIWFFDANSHQGFVNANSCTAENPCSSPSFNQSTIDSINAVSTGNPLFYFRAGSYSALTNGSPDVLTNDSLYSRNYNYTAPQRGAIFSGGFVINGQSTLDSITLFNSSEFVQPVGLMINPGAKVTLNNSVVGAVNNNTKQAYTTAIHLSDSNLTVTNHSEIYAYSNNTTPAIGIATQDSTGSTINLSNQCLVTASVLGLTSTDNYAAMGIAATSTAGNSTAKINIANGCVIKAIGSGTFGTFNIAGISETENNNQLNISGNSLVSATTSVTYGPTISVTGVQMAGATNNLQVSSSEVDANANISTGTPYLQTSLSATGIHVAGHNNTVALTNSQVNAAVNTTYAQQVVAQGIAVDDQGAGSTTVSVDDSQLQVNATVNNLISLTAPVYAVTTQGIDIDTTAVSGNFTNTVSLTNNSMLSVNSSIVNATLVIGAANQILSEGIVIGSEAGSLPAGNLNNTVTVNNSSVQAGAVLTNGGTDDPNIVIATGIDLVSSYNSTQIVNINNAANVQATATLVNGGNDYNTPNDNTATATGVNMVTGSVGSNTLNVNNSSTLQANATIENGGNFANQAIAAGTELAAGSNSFNYVTVGTSGNNNDHSTVTADAIIQQGGGDTNAHNSALAYGINVYNTAGNVTNTIILQGASIIDATAKIMNGSTGLGINSATSTGVSVKGADNHTTLKDSTAITASAASNGTSSSATATGIDSMAPLGITNVVDNQVDPVSNSNIQALENGVNSGILINQHN